MSAPPPHLRILQPHPGLFAYYDGRIAGYRFDPRPNWVDDGALSLGVATFALTHGDQAIVCDTGTTPAHGAAIRAHLDGIGIRQIRVVYSHWHKDHVAGTAAFGDVEVIANARTAAHLKARKAAIEAGITWPPIAPLVLPTTTFADEMKLALGPRQIMLIAANIHSDDATVIWLPDTGILLAGDTLEDPVTFVAEPGHFATHLTELDRLGALNPAHILPCHGDPDVIAAGGYGADLIPATQHYIRWLMALRDQPSLRDQPLGDVIAAGLASGTLHGYQPYEAVHRSNVSAALQGVAHG